MNHKTHKNATILVGGILLASLLLNQAQTLLRDPGSFVDMFKWTKEVGMPWIAYISMGVICLSAIGAAGLIRYRRWGFYCMYVNYLAAASAVWFPFSPGFIFQFILNPA